MNGYRSEQEELSATNTQICCLVEDNERCKRQAGNASYSKRIQKTVGQRKLKLSLDTSARHIYICEYHKNMIQSVRSKRKRKESDDEHDSLDVDFCSLQVNTLRRYKRHYKLQTRPGLNKAQLVEIMDSPFAATRHMVQNLPCWMASYKLGHQKQRKVKIDWLKSLCSKSCHILLPSSMANYVPCDHLLQKTIQRHFKQLQCQEKETITYFIYMIKTNKSKLDQKQDS